MQTRGQKNKRIILPFSWHWAVCPEMSFWSLGFTKPHRHCMGKCSQKWRQAPLWVGSILEVICMDDPFVKSPKAVVKVVPHNWDAAALCKMASLSSSTVQHKTPRHCLTRPSRTVNGQHVAPSSEQIRLGMNTWNMKPSSLCEGNPAVMPFSSNCHLLTCFCATPSDPGSILPSLTSCPINYLTQGCGLTSCHSGRQVNESSAHG